MRCTTCLVAALAAVASAQETLLGVYIWTRHGDRTAKSTPPVNLTSLGYQEVVTSGDFFRNRYVASGATRPIYGISSNVVRQSQLAISAPWDTVLQNSASGFLQGLYPPMGGSETLRNGTVITTPFNGTQLIPVNIFSTGANNENSAWLQGGTNCGNAQLSSNNYFFSTEYLQTLNRTQSFYDTVRPMVNRTFTASQTSFKNAYTIWDLLNVANIHNSSTNFPSADLLTSDTFYQLKILADQHEFGLAYNNSEPIRAITGAIIASEVVTALNSTITDKTAAKLNVQFGAYAGMLSFFGLSNLTQVNTDFTGVPDYASALIFELVTNATVNSTTSPSMDQISVRFLFHNGTTSSSSQPIEYPLFNTGRSPLPWTDFANGMGKFSVNGQRQWCQACGNSTGVCSEASLSNTAGGLSSSSSSDNSSDGGMSRAVAGVIGAMVTLAVILGVSLLVVFAGGFRLVNKKKLSHASPSSSVVETTKA